MPEFRVRGWGWWGRDKGQSIGATGSSSCWPEESGVIRRTRAQAGGNRERSMCFGKEGSIADLMTQSAFTSSVCGLPDPSNDPTLDISKVGGRTGHKRG